MLGRSGRTGGDRRKGSGPRCLGDSKKDGQSRLDATPVAFVKNNLGKQAPVQGDGRGWASGAEHTAEYTNT